MVLRTAEETEKEPCLLKAKKLMEAPMYPQIEIHNDENV
jgi:hypothetical protein